MMETFRNLTRRKLRSILTISGIVIGIFALTTMGALAERFNQQLEGGVTFYGSNIQVGVPDGQLVALLPLSKMEAIASVTGVDAVFPTYSFLLKPGSGLSFGGAPESIVNRIPQQTPREQPPTSIAQGRDLNPTASREVVLGSKLAIEFRKHIGDTFDLPVKPASAGPEFVNHTFTVVGILNPTGTAPDGFALVTTPDARTLLADSLPQVFQRSVDLSQVAPEITVYGKPGASIGQLDEIARQINRQVPGIKATEPSVPVNGFKQFAALFTTITTAAALLALVIGGLSVVNTMIMAVSERVREIGLKKAVGAHTGDVLREYLMEAGFIGLIGGVGGYVLGFGLTGLINASTGASPLFLITPKLTILVIGFAVVLGSLAGVLPALRAARRDPVTALRTSN